MTSKLQQLPLAVKSFAEDGEHVGPHPCAIPYRGLGRKLWCPLWG